MQTVVILGASSKPDRYSYKCLMMLLEYGHKPILAHPKEREIEGIKVYRDLKEVAQAGIEVDTLTMYVSAEISLGLAQDMVNLRPKRVIFNPGSENPDLYVKLIPQGIKVEEACSLVLMRTGQFDFI